MQPCLELVLLPTPGDEIFGKHGEPVWLQDGAHRSNGTESSLWRHSITSCPDSARNASWRSSHPLCRGAYPRNQCFAQRGAAQPLPCRGGPRFPPQHRPRFPEERRALRDRSPPTHSLSQRPGRGPWERAAILSAHRPLWASGGAQGRVFQAGGWGNLQRAPRTGLGGDASMPPASRSPRPPRRSPADSPPPSLRTAPPTTGTFSNFSLPGKRRGPASALSRGPGRGTPGGRPSGSEDPPPVPAQRSALGGAQPSVPALRERPGWRREGEARRADAEETEVPPAPSGHRPAGTGSGVLWQSVVTGTP